MPGPDRERERHVHHIDDVTLGWDTDAGAMSFFGLPAVTFWLAPSLLHMLRPLVDEIGRERFRALVIDHASQGTDEDYHAMVTVLADNFADGFLAWGRAVGVAGWGRFELERFDLDSGTARVVVRNAWELRMHADPSLGWGCPFLMGKMIGIFGHALGGNCTAVESEVEGGVAFDIRRAEVCDVAPCAADTPAGETPLVRGPTAAAALEAVGALAGGIAHNFNNRLATILGCVSMAQNRSADPAELARLLALTEVHIGRARQLTQQLLTFSTGGEPIRRAVDVARLARDVAARPELVGRVPCRLRIDEGVGQIHADPDQVGQAIAELVRNGAEASPDDGAIEIEVSRSEVGDGQPALRVTVRDFGAGLSEAARRRALELFFSTKAGAAGLGLSVAYSVANRHGGTLHFDSQPGETAFHLTLPATSGDAASEAPAGTIPPGLRVLMVDDHPDVLEVGHDMLAVLGCEAICADHGVAALERFEQARGDGNPIQVVVLDLMLPGDLGGVATYEAMREAEPGVRVIVSSGYHDDPVMADYLRHGMRAVLPKPYTLDDLRRALLVALA